MKIDVKILRIVAGIICIVSACNCGLSIVSGITNSIEAGYMVLNPVNLIMSAYGFFVCLYLGLLLLKRKKINVAVSALCIVYMLYIVFNMIVNLKNGINISSLLLVAAFVLVQMNNEEFIYFIRKLTHKVESKQKVTEQQSSIYEEQLRDNIITQEEYDQLMGLSNSTKDNTDSDNTIALENH